MLRHDIVDPIAKEGKDIEFAKYVEMHQNQTGPTNEKLYQTIHDEFYDAHRDIDRLHLDEIWEFIGPKVANNTGIAEFIKDNDGHLSNYFFPWLINVFRSPATALEMSYGEGPGLDGVWNDDIIQTDDPLVPFIKDDPAFVYNRERQMRVADIAMSIYDEAWDTQTEAKIVDFGAGRLAWYRHHYSVLYDTYWIQLHAFDKDPTIHIDMILGQNYDDEHIYYEKNDFTSELTNPKLKESKLILLGGVASYTEPEVFARKIVPSFHSLLKDKGIFFFDMQLDCPCYRHSMDILGWPKFSVPNKSSEVIDKVEAMRSELWKNGIKFSAEYNTDTFNSIPSSVMITFQKMD